jgi:hypothetical protein
MIRLTPDATRPRQRTSARYAVAANVSSLHLPPSEIMIELTLDATYQRP